MRTHDDHDKLDVYGGRDPSLIPFCSLRECAEWLSLPSSTVRAWFLGQSGFEPVLKLDDPASRMLSFVNLTEVFVLAAIRRKHQIPLSRVREAVKFLQKRLGDDHPLASQEMSTEGSAILVEQLGKLVSASEHGQVISEELVRARLRRIERNAQGVPMRLYPLTRRGLLSEEPAGVEQAPTSVVIDPRIQFGRPCLNGTGVPTAVIHERWLAGEDIQEIAADYGRELSDGQEALRFEDRRAA
jgi:uncharacterized protein (DUF433 family)